MTETVVWSLGMASYIYVPQPNPGAYQSYFESLQSMAAGGVSPAMMAAAAQPQSANMAHTAVAGLQPIHQLLLNGAAAAGR